MDISNFDFNLPKSLIASKPLKPRSSAKLLFYEQSSIKDLIFFNLPDILSKNDLLVFNNTISDFNNTRHELSEHAALPVIEGEKFAFNLWFRECNYKMLYKDFNPNYYGKEKSHKTKYKSNIKEVNKELVKMAYEKIDLAIIVSYDILADEKILTHLNLCVELECNKNLSQKRRLRS